MGKSFLEVEHIRKSFGSVEVLKDISFSLEKGQVLSIIGASGSGKTTLLRCLNFLETPDRGVIRVNGETLFDRDDPSTLAHIRRKRLHFGLVFQAFNLFPQYTVLENVTLAPKLLSKEHLHSGTKADKSAVSFAEIQAHARELLTQIGLADRMNSYPHQLSGGQQQRVAIARALALHPDILCFDEPTSALDPELTGEVLKVIRELAAHRTTNGTTGLSANEIVDLSANKTADLSAMIIVTHEMAFARDVASHVIFMDDGRICEQGAPEQVFGNPREKRTQQFLSRFNG